MYDEFCILGDDMVQSIREKISKQNFKLAAFLAYTKESQQQELSALFASEKEEFLKAVQNSLNSFLEGSFTKQMDDELTGIGSDIIRAVNKQIVLSTSFPTPKFAAASTEQQKGESSKATKVAEESRRLEEEKRLREEAERILRAEAAEKEKAEAEAVQRAEAEAKARAEAKAVQQAETEAKAKAEVEARQKAETESKVHTDRAEVKKATKEMETQEVHMTTEVESEKPIEIASDSSSSSDDQHPISRTIQKMRMRKEGASDAAVETPKQTNIQQSEVPLVRKKSIAKKTPKRKEPEGKTPAEEEAERQRKGKSRVQEVTEKMDTLKTKPPKYFTETMREFPERIHSYLYSQGREGYNYYAMFPVFRTSDEIKYIERVIKDPKDIFSTSPIKGIPEVTVTSSTKNIVNVKFKVTREDGTEMGFSDVDLPNLCCYDLHDLYGMMYNQEGKSMKYSIAKVKIMQAIKDCVRKNARRDFELALVLGLEKTDLEKPDEDLYDLEVTDVYIPVPEANGMSFLNEEGELRIYRVDNSMKYSNETLIFLHNELVHLKQQLTPEQIQTKEKLIESFEGQLNYRRHIMIMVGILKSIPDEAKDLDRFLAEKPIFERT